MPTAPASPSPPGASPWCRRTARWSLAMDDTGAGRVGADLGGGGWSKVLVMLDGWGRSPTVRHESPLEIRTQTYWRACRRRSSGPHRLLVLCGEETRLLWG